MIQFLKYNLIQINMKNIIFYICRLMQEILYFTKFTKLIKITICRSENKEKIIAKSYNLLIINNAKIIFAIYKKINVIFK